MNTPYNSMIEKLTSSLKAKFSNGERIRQGGMQDLYDVGLSPLEVQEFVKNSEFDEEDNGWYCMVFNLDEAAMDAFTAEEREAYLRGDCIYETITTCIWIEKKYCLGVDTDTGICDEEAWQYSWHGN